MTGCLWLFQRVQYQTHNSPETERFDVLICTGVLSPETTMLSKRPEAHLNYLKFKGPVC